MPATPDSGSARNSGKAAFLTRIAVVKAPMP